MKPKIFLSYDSQDQSWAGKFAHTLEERGFDVWFEEDHLSLGDGSQHKLENALRDSGILICILSKNSVKSSWMYFDIGVALADDKTIIPMIMDDLGHEQIPPIFTRYQYLREQSPDAASQAVAKLFEEPGVSVS